MKTLLLVDGSSLMMRAAFGGDIPPEKSLPNATGLVERATRMAEATHRIIALDSDAPTWRALEFPPYKAHRTRDTAPWLAAAHAEWSRRGWYMADLNGWEADDILATLATRAAPHFRVVVASADSDLLSLTELPNLTVLRPQNGGTFTFTGAADVCAKYSIARPGLLRDLKALVGEAGDNVPGVPTIGSVRAAKLLKLYGELDAIIAAGHAKQCPHSITVAEHEQLVRLAQRLVTLRLDTPLPPILPRDCALSA